MKKYTKEEVVELFNELTGFKGWQKGSGTSFTMKFDSVNDFLKEKGLIEEEKIKKFNQIK